MRSASVRMLMRMCEYKSYSLDGGYRAFRGLVQQLVTLTLFSSKHPLYKSQHEKKQVKNKTRGQLSKINLKSNEVKGKSGKPKPARKKAVPAFIEQFNIGLEHLNEEDWKTALDCFSTAESVGHPVPAACQRWKARSVYT